MKMASVVRAEGVRGARTGIVNGLRSDDKTRTSARQAGELLDSERSRGVRRTIGGMLEAVGIHGLDVADPDKVRLRWNPDNLHCRAIDPFGHTFATITLNEGGEVTATRFHITEYLLSIRN